jgi:hypothetical protein
MGFKIRDNTTYCHRYVLKLFLNVFSEEKKKEFKAVRPIFFPVL